MQGSDRAGRFSRVCQIGIHVSASVAAVIIALQVAAHFLFGADDLAGRMAWIVVIFIGLAFGFLLLALLDALLALARIAYRQARNS